MNEMYKFLGELFASGPFNSLAFLFLSGIAMSMFFSFRKRLTQLHNGGNGHLKDIEKHMFRIEKNQDRFEKNQDKLFEKVSSLAIQINRLDARFEVFNKKH